jgi:hypothetical protein
MLQVLGKQQLIMEKFVETPKLFFQLKFQLFIYSRGGQSAAQKEFFAAQTRIENQRFFDILDVFLQVFVIMRPKKPIILTKFSSCGPKTNLGWPPLIYSSIKIMETLKMQIY